MDENGTLLSQGKPYGALGSCAERLRARDDPPNFVFNTSGVRVWREGCRTGWRAHCEWIPVFPQKAVSVTAGTDSWPQGVLYINTPGRRRSSDVCDEAAGTLHPGVLRQRVPVLGRY